MTLFRGQTENAGHFLQPTAKAIGHSVILDSSSVWPYAPLRDTRSPKLREKFPQSPFIHRAAAAPVSFWLCIEGDERVRSRLVHSVYEHLKEQQTLRRNANSAPNHNAIIGRGCKIPFKGNARGFVWANQTEIGLPPAFRHLLHPSSNSATNLLSVESRWQRGIRKIDGFRLLADEQHPFHDRVSINHDFPMARSSCSPQRYLSWAAIFMAVGWQWLLYAFRCLCRPY